MKMILEAAAKVTAHVDEREREKLKRSVEEYNARHVTDLERYLEVLQKELVRRIKGTKENGSKMYSHWMKELDATTQALDALRTQ